MRSLHNRLWGHSQNSSIWMTEGMEGKPGQVPLAVCWALQGPTRLSSEGASATLVQVVKPGGHRGTGTCPPSGVATPLRNALVGTHSPPGARDLSPTALQGQGSHSRVSMLQAPRCLHCEHPGVYTEHPGCLMQAPRCQASMPWAPRCLHCRHLQATAGIHTPHDCGPLTPQPGGYPDSQGSMHGLCLWHLPLSDGLSGHRHRVETCSFLSLTRGSGVPPHSSGESPWFLVNIQTGLFVLLCVTVTIGSPACPCPCGWLGRALGSGS